MGSLARGQTSNDRASSRGPCSCKPKAKQRKKADVTDNVSVFPDTHNLSIIERGENRDKVFLVLIYCIRLLLGEFGSVD